MLWSSRHLFKLSRISTKCGFLPSTNDLLINTHQISFSTIPGSYKGILTPQVVQSTILNCHSDLIALSFFIWCAKQPNYFHDKATCVYMVNVVSRLTQRFVTIKGVLDELENAGTLIKPQVLLLLLRIYWLGRMHNMVIEAFGEILKYGYTPNTFSRNILMDVLFKIGCASVALQVLKETKSPNFLTFSISIGNLCKLKDMVNLQSVLRTMLRNGYYLNPETFSSVLSCYCKSGQLSKATQLLGFMIALGVPTCVIVWSIVINGYSKSGKLDFASHLLNKMVSSGCMPNMVTCTSLVKGYLEFHMPSKAFEILDTMKSIGCCPDLIMCNVLIHGLSKIGNYDEAIDVFCSLGERGLTPDSYTLSSIVSTVCLCKEFTLLPVLINGLDIHADLVVCNSFLSFFCKAGYPKGAVEFYNDMIYRGFQPDNYTFAGLLSGLCRLGKTSQAVDVYQGIVKNQDGLDAHIHTVIINELIKSGEFHQAIRLFRKAAEEKLHMDVVTYTVAIDGLVKGGLVEDAYDVFSMMKEIGLAPNIYTYSFMLSGLCENVDVITIKRILVEMVDGGIELNHITFRLMKNILRKRRHSSLVLNLFMELCDKAVHDLNVKDVFSDNNHHLLVLDTDTSSSEDILDVAASVG
ncbi:unnamed protein product [Cuscuta epithymum]|uniref:Pentatricopeptide repeat-containing protein n=1 Tax=Cuscuta epithymum TaxID=186058 RepID=A0AAV0EA76_9ASTE|nr:unnamed protein product [Cuscuta epithymum]